jgi:cell division protein FtsL
MFIEWVKQNTKKFIQKNKDSIKNWAKALYVAFEIITLALYLTIVSERAGVFTVIDKDDFMNRTIHGLALISDKILLVTLVIPAVIYLVYRLYKSFRAAQRNYREFVSNNGQIPTVKEPDSYDPYPKS